MAKDIEEFLKMAAARRKKSQNQQQQQQRKPPRQPQRQPIEPEIEIIDDEEVVDLGSQSVASHVETHIDTREIAKHASHLGENVGAAREKVKERIQRKFDHEVGHLKVKTREGVTAIAAESTKEKVSPVALDLVNLLTSPQSIRSAILLNEILRRPDFD